MGPATFGHTGFTGTSVWIDPDRGVFVVILTNRVYAPRNRRSISRLKIIRGEVADAAMLLGSPACGPTFAVRRTTPTPAAPPAAPPARC